MDNPMKDLIDRAPGLKVLQQRTRKQLGTRKLAIMQKADLEHYSDTMVISGTTEPDRSGTSVQQPGARPSRTLSRK